MSGRGHTFQDAILARAQARGLTVRDSLGVIMPPGPPPQVEPMAPTNGKAALFALGHLAPGEKNKTEQKFEDEYLIPRQIAGEILWYSFDAIKLRLADRTFLTVDFAVLPASREFTLIDVKGSKAIIQEDARVKMAVAAGAFPFKFQYAFPDNGGWLLEDV